MEQVLIDPRMLEPEPPQWIPITHRDFSIDHTQQGMFLMSFGFEGGVYTLITRFRRFEVDGVLALHGGSRPKVASGRVEGRCARLSFFVGVQEVALTISEGLRFLVAEGGGWKEQIYYDVHRLV